jgi:hypothetical protein
MTGDDELRFAKKQQWYVATSAVTLLGAIFAIARVTKLNLAEKDVATFFIALVAAFGIYFLWKLQHRLKRVRLVLDPTDKNPLLRGVDIALVLSGIIAVSMLVVLYFLWCPHATASGLQ